MLKYIQTLNGDLQPSKRGNYYRVVDVDRHIDELKYQHLSEMSEVAAEIYTKSQETEAMNLKLKLTVGVLIGVIVILIGKLL
jgi:uncharacterized transporter YbjL